jgi:hypothetical protein
MGPVFHTIAGIQVVDRLKLIGFTQRANQPGVNGIILRTKSVYYFIHLCRLILFAARFMATKVSRNTLTSMPNALVRLEGKYRTLGAIRLTQ